MSYEEYVVTAQKGGLQPSGRRFAYRLAETFFRRWPLYLIPLLLVCGFGVAMAVDSVPTYTTTGTLRVASNPLLASAGPSMNDERIYWETAAETTARLMNEQLGTDQFIDQVAASAGVSPQVEAGLLTRGDLRGAVFVSPNGATLLRVSAVWGDGQTSLALANSTISEYVKYVVEGQVLESTQAEQFWADLEVTYQAELEAAEQALSEYFVAHPPPPRGVRPDDEAFQLARLNERVSAANNRVTNAQNRRQEATLAAQQARSQAGANLQIVDSPRLPAPSQTPIRDRILTFAMYGILGAIISAVGLLVVTLLDRSVRTSDDITLTTGLPVVATVPIIPRKRRPSGNSPARQPVSAA